jgi:hypothetical protein
MPFLTEGMSFFGEAHSGEAAFRRAYPQYAGGTDMASASLMQYYVFLHRRSCQINHAGQVFYVLPGVAGVEPFIQIEDKPFSITNIFNLENSMCHNCY